MIVYRVTAGAGGSRRTIGEFETKADLEHALPRLEREWSRWLVQWERVIRP